MEQAVALFGSEAKLGTAIGYTQHGVHRARASGRVTPVMAVRIHVATGGQIDCKLLCPALDVAAQVKRRRTTRRKGARNGGR